ncbi:pilus assembly protein PilC [candidate division TA06 bacterium DG_26]|uniref:Pilus assembly protein PilC n=1 Tax=candidate division TA06 bacterium DG_26 TaxID=1703771 RepID=A0A0S7WHT6_UNCT6|nr:MAG: pilus assembly protein PilC [candidate division TA06 bacterium DG_26]
MPVFVWKGRTSSGLSASGELAAESEAEVIAHLRARKIIPTSVKTKPKEVSIPFLSGRISTKELAVFTRQFATMINSGLPLMQCLDIQSQQADSSSFKKVLWEVMEDVESGSTLAEALRKHKNIFSDLYVNMVAAGETGGALDVVLGRLSRYLEKSAALARKIKGAMIYPAIIIGVSLLAIVILLVFVIPVFATMFETFGGQLPLPTRIVLALSTFVKKYIIFAILGLLAAGVGVRYLRKSPNGKGMVDKVLLKLPIAGDLVRKQAIARFSRTLATLLSSGVPILDALEITAKTSGNKVIEDSILAARVSISEGETIAEPLKQVGAFPPMVTQMISIGEAAGNLDEMLNKVADFYDSEVDAAVENLTAALEPVIIVILGVFVGGMMVSMYLPIFKFVTLIRGD